MNAESVRNSRMMTFVSAADPRWAFILPPELWWTGGYQSQTPSMVTISCTMTFAVKGKMSFLSFSVFSVFSPPSYLTFSQFFAQISWTMCTEADNAATTLATKITTKCFKLNINSLECKFVLSRRFEYLLTLTFTLK